MTDDLRTRIAAVLAEAQETHNGISDLALADAVIAELGPIPDRTYVDDQGRTWEWCGGQPGTWAWRITQLPQHVTADHWCDHPDDNHNGECL